MTLPTIPEKTSSFIPAMTLLPTHRISMNASSVPSTFLRKLCLIGLVTCLFVLAFYVFKHYHHIGHHLRLKHHPGHPHHDKEDKIKEAINANLEKLRSRAGNIYLDNDEESNHHFDDRHDDDHEDDDYDDDHDEDDEYDDSDEDDDDDDEGTPNNQVPAPK